MVVGRRAEAQGGKRRTGYHPIAAADPRPSAGPAARTGGVECFTVCTYPAPLQLGRSTENARSRPLPQVHMMSLFDKLQSTMAATLKVSPAEITPQSRNEDLPSWDSLGQVNLIMALEQTFDVYIEVEEFGNLTSVPAILEYLEKAGAD